MITECFSLGYIAISTYGWAKVQHWSRKREHAQSQQQMPRWPCTALCALLWCSHSCSLKLLPVCPTYVFLHVSGIKIPFILCRQEKSVFSGGHKASWNSRETCNLWREHALTKADWSWKRKGWSLTTGEDTLRSMRKPRQSAAWYVWYHVRFGLTDCFTCEHFCCWERPVESLSGSLFSLRCSHAAFDCWHGCHCFVS